MYALTRENAVEEYVSRTSRQKSLAFLPESTKYANLAIICCLRPSCRYSSPAEDGPHRSSARILRAKRNEARQPLRRSGAQAGTYTSSAEASEAIDTSRPTTTMAFLRKAANKKGPEGPFRCCACRYDQQETLSALRWACIRELSRPSCMQGG